MRGGSDMSFLLGCDLPLSGLSGCLSLKLKQGTELLHVSDKVELPVSRLQDAVVCVGCVLAVSFVAHFCYLSLLPFGLGLQQHGDMCRHYSVMQAACCSMFLQCVFFWRGKNVFLRTNVSSFCHGLSMGIDGSLRKMWVLHNKECMVAKQG